MAEITNSVTPYHYCLNNPIKFTDPTGMLTTQEMFDDAWNKTPAGKNRTYNYNSDDPDNKPTTGIPTSYNDILKGIGDFFGLGLDPKDPKNIDKIELGQKRIEDATNAINEVNKTIIINGVLIIVSEGVGYAIAERGGAILLRILSKGELKAAEGGLSVIGPRATYRQFAEEIGANYLKVSDEAWTWAKNEKFLAGVVKRGDDVIFSGKFNPAKLDPSSVLAREINYLTERGYHWTSDFSKMIIK